jgi:hypothetical protein
MTYTRDGPQAIPMFDLGFSRHHAATRRGSVVACAGQSFTIGRLLPGASGKTAKPRRAKSIACSYSVHCVRDAYIRSTPMGISS